MTYQGYMALANDDGETIELVNAARVKAYTDNLAPSIGLRGCDDCDGLPEALGEAYVSPTADNAPWYDPTDAATADFYGVYPLSFEGIDDSTRSIESAELTGDGSVVVGSRFTGKDIRVTGMAFAKDEAALYAGVSWLDNALNGTEDGRCFGDRLNLYSSCPAIEVLPPNFAEPYTMDLGTPSRVNLVADPRATVAARWAAGFGTGGVGTETMVVGAVDGPVIAGNPAVTTYARYTWTTGNIGGTPTMGYSYVNAAPLVGPYPVGTPFAAAIYARPSVAVPTAFAYVSQQVSGADGPNINLPNGTLPANVWTRIGGTGTLTAVSETLNVVGVQLSSFNAPTGMTIDVVAAMATPDETTLGTYFDGATTDTASFVYGYLGDFGLSESVEIPTAAGDAEAAQWTTTSGTIQNEADGIRFDWTAGDPQKIACREITGLIPGEQYQLRTRLEDFGNYYVSLGPACAERYENLLPDPRLTATTMTTVGATVVDTHPSSGAPDGGSYFSRSVITPNTTSPMTMDLSPTGLSAVPIAESQVYTASWYEAGAPDAGSALVLNGVSPGRAWTPDAAVLDITGDLDVEVHLAMDDWTPAAASAPISKWFTVAANQRSWTTRVEPNGRLTLFWSQDGIAALSATSTVAPVVTNGEPLWIRYQLDVNNGAAGRDIKFFTSVDGVTWVQLGTTVTQAGVTSIFNSTAQVNIGAYNDGGSERLAGRVFSAKIRSGLSGTIVANPDFSVQPAGTTSFLDGQGLTWTIAAPATIAAAPSGARIDWTWYDAAGAVISSGTGSSHGATTGWQRFTQVLTSPALAAFVQPRLIWTGFVAAGQQINLAQAQLNLGSTAPAYIDGSYPDVRWTGDENASSSVLERNVDYQTIFGWETSHEPPTEPTVLDFIPRATSIFVSITPTPNTPTIPTLALLVEDLLVRRIDHPGVVAFGTGDDAVPPTDGWTHTAPTGVEVTWQLRNTSVYTRARNPFGGASTYLTTHGVSRTLFGLTPGSRYRLMVEFNAGWAATDANPLIALTPVITLTNSAGVSTTYNDDNVGTLQYFRVVEFTATGTTSVLSFNPNANLALGSYGTVFWEFQEYMVEEILEPDTSTPQPGRDEARTMYQVKASQGPTLTNVRSVACGVMGQITYALRAGNPFKYHLPEFAGGLPTGASTEVADVPCSDDGLPQIVNFMFNPSLETNATGYAVTGTGATGARVLSSASSVVGDYIYRGSAPNSAGNLLASVTASYLVASVVDGPIPVPGEELTASIYFRTTSALWVGTYDWSLAVTMVGFPAIVFTGQEVIIGADTFGAWRRIEQTFTLPENIALSSIVFTIEPPASLTQGGLIEVDAFMIQRGDTATAPYDQTFAEASWSGTTGASALLLNQTVANLSEDPDCPTPPTPPAPPVIDSSCITAPTTYTRTVVNISEDTIPRSLSAYPVITLIAGSADVRQARIRFWPNPDNLTIDSMDACSYEGEIDVSYLAAGGTLVIDGVLHEATVSLPGFADQNANQVLYGPDGGPVEWPELSGGIPYLVTLELDSTAPYTDTLMLIDLVVRD